MNSKISALALYEREVVEVTDGLSVTERILLETLLRVAWERGGYLPDNRDSPRRYCPPGVRFSRAWPAIQDRFVIDPGVSITHPILLEKLRAKEIRAAAKARSIAKKARERDRSRGAT